MPENNLNNLFSHFSISHVFTALLGLLGTAYMFIFGSLKKSLNHAHERIDELERHKVNHDDIHEMKKDLRKIEERIDKIYTLLSGGYNVK